MNLYNHRMAKAKQKEQDTDIPDVSVKLKPISGIKPEYYLPVIYLLALVLIIFLVLFLPGITNHGSKVTFVSIPDKSPVYVDGMYIGSTPCTAFIKSGAREIKFRKPFYKEIAQKENIQGGVFGTLFFPIKKTIFVQCTLDDADGLMHWAMNDFASFGMLSDFTVNYQLPPLISDTTAAVRGSGDSVAERMYGFLNNAMYFVDSEQELYELIKGFSLNAAKAKGFSSFTALAMLKKIIQLKDKYNGFPCWFTAALPLTSQGRKIYKDFISTPWFTNYFTRYKENILTIKKREKQGRENLRTAVIRGIPFVSFAGAAFVMGNSSSIESSFYPDMDNLPHAAQIKAFTISAIEITNKEYLAFVNAETAWLPSNREKLISEEKTTDQYLSHWIENKPAESDIEKPVTNISWYAAQAYCSWFTANLPASYKGFPARLPYEAEWEFIAKNIEKVITVAQFFPEQKELSPHNAGTGKYDTFPVKDMFGNTWEWCDTWFFPMGYQLSEYSGNLAEDRQLHQYIDIGSEKVVRGGSWANSKSDNITSSTRGSQPPAWCTPYLGFRIVLSEFK